MKKPTAASLFLGALTASALLVGGAHSATLVVGQSLIIGSQSHPLNKGGVPAYHVSVNTAKAGFAAINRQTTDQVDAPDLAFAFTEAVQGHRFITANPANTIVTVTSKGVSISMGTTDTAFDSFNSSAAKIWVASNPGADLEKPAIGPDFSAGIRSISNVTGSIDISGLASGTVYFFYGGYRCRPSIIACMIDADGPRPGIMVDNFHNGDSANSSERYMSSITFVNDAGYDTIEYDFSAGNGNWEGVVVTGKMMP